MDENTVARVAALEILLMTLIRSMAHGQRQALVNTFKSRAEIVKTAGLSTQLPEQMRLYLEEHLDRLAEEVASGK